MGGIRAGNINAGSLGDPFILEDGTINPNSTEIVEDVSFAADGTSASRLLWDLNEELTPALVNILEITGRDNELNDVIHQIGVQGFSGEVFRLASDSQKTGLSYLPSLILNGQTGATVLSVDDYSSSDAMIELYPGYYAAGYGYNDYAEAFAGGYGIWSDGEIYLIGGSQGLSVLNTNPVGTTTADLIVFDGEDNISTNSVSSPVIAGSNIGINGASATDKLTNSFFGGVIVNLDLSSSGGYSNIACLGGAVVPDKSNFLFTNNFEIQDGIGQYTVAPDTNGAWGDLSIPHRGYVDTEIAELQSAQTFTLSNVTPDYIFDPTSTTLDETAMVLATLIQVLQNTTKPILQ